MLILKKTKLNELGKYGFEYQDGKYVKVEEIKLSKHQMCRSTTWVIEEKGMNWVIFHNSRYGIDTIYDMIQAGLVEKVVE